MKTIFIAYNRKDKVIARFIYHNLLKQNWADIEVFMDEFSIQPGEDIKEKCLAKAKIADLGIVILSEYIQKSEYAPQEIGILLSRDISKIYVALHENWQIPPGYEKTIRSLPLYEEKDPSEGLEKLTKLVRDILKPREIGSVELLNKGSRLANQGKFEEALEYAKKAIQIDPNYDVAYIAKIENLRKLRRYDEALQTVKEALLIFPDHGRVLWHKGFLLYSMKKFSEAIDTFGKISDMTGGRDQSSLYYKGRCLERQGLFDEAAKVYDACYKINPNSNKGIAALRMKGTLKIRTKVDNVEEG